MSTQRDTRPHRSYRLAAGVLLTVFVTWAAVYSVVTPLWEAPDEPAHFEYAAFLRQHLALPVQTVGGMDMAHHPPLYYALAAVAMLPADLADSSGAFRLNPNFIWQAHGGLESNASFHNSAETFPYSGVSLAVHLDRLLSITMATLTVALIIAIGWQIFPTRPTLGLLAGALVAFNPQFLFTSAAVMNDNLLILAATGTLWQALRAVKTPQQDRQWLLLGLWVSVAVLAKVNGFVFGFIAGLALLACAVRFRSFTLALRGGLLMGAVVVALTGWWWVRNLQLYQDPLGLSAYYLRRAPFLRTSPLAWRELLDMVSTQWRSALGVFGWMTLGMPEWYYWAAGVVVLAGVVGIGVTVVTGRMRQLSRYQVAALLYLAGAIIIDELVMVIDVNRTGASQYQGRYLFPVIAPVAIVLAYGLLGLTPRRAGIPLTVGWAALMACVALVTPFSIIAPAYVSVTLPKRSLWLRPHPTQAVFGSTFALRAYELAGVDGASLDVTLYWQAEQQPNRNDSVFVHLLDAQGRMVAQQDQAPGSGAGYLPLQWLRGDIVADRWQVHLPQPLAPGEYRLRVGVYDPATGARLPMSVGGQPAGDFIVLDQAWEYPGTQHTAGQ